jgi:hypothetical protein
MAEPSDMTLPEQRAAFYAHYLRHYSRHVVVALLFGAAAILATALLDWLFQPEVAAIIWRSRAAALLPMLAIAGLCALPALRQYQQPLIVVFTLIGCLAVLDFARLSVEPYTHYYNNAVVLIIVFCFMLTRVLLRWGLLCAGLLFVACNIYWVGINRDGIDLVVIKNFILFLTCAFSLTATWNLEHSLFRNFQQQQAGERERQRLDALQQEMARQSWENARLADYQTRISGSHSVEALAAITLGFADELFEVGFAEAFLQREQELTSVARRALPGHRHSGQPAVFGIGDGLVGECARQQVPLLLAPVPPGYAHISSGTGSMAPSQVAVFPALFEGRCTGVVELAMLKPLNDSDQHLFSDIMQRFGQALAMAELREGPLRKAG